MTYSQRSNAVRATAEAYASLPDDVRAARAAHLQERDRQQRLVEARAGVEAARVALERVRDTTAEEAALDIALKRLADIEGEKKDQL